MPLECHVHIDSEDEETARVSWELRDGPDLLARGRVDYDLETVHFRWQEHRPPHEHEGLVRTSIDRAIRRRG